MDYKAEARELVKGLNQRMGPSPYDIAWLARLPAGLRSADWPDWIEWLLSTQYDDGSWGSQIVYYHDRVMCTLAAAVALRQNGGDQLVRTAVQRAEYYVWQHVHLLRHDPFELVGFELLFPALLQEARTLGMDVPSHAFGYGEMQTKKLHLIPPELLYSSRVTTIHSLEFLGRSADPDQLRAAVGPNGSLGNSPAATAYYLSLSRCDDGRARAYLETVYRHYGHIVVLYPFAVYETIWVLNNLSHAEQAVTKFIEPDPWQSLKGQMTQEGVSLDPSFRIPDGDNTSVLARLLIEVGDSFNPSILARFQNEKTGLFHTYDYERNISVGTNIHALEALDRMPDYPHYVEVRNEILLFLLTNRIRETYWIDKWHASPYYATAHALIALLKDENQYVKRTCVSTVEWLLHTQRADGSWGFLGEGTAEETAYVLTALVHYHRRGKLAHTDVLRRAADYLVRAYADNQTAYPGLYIDKVLYLPQDIVRSAILAALILYFDTL